jgi:hypothetical protein
MAVFKFQVIETRTVLCEYAVEADTLEEAREKAEIGDTTIEIPNESSMEVLDRLIENVVEG